MMISQEDYFSQRRMILTNHIDFTRINKFLKKINNKALLNV